MLGEYDINIKMAKELEKRENKVDVGNVNKLDENIKEIEDYEQEG